MSDPLATFALQGGSWGLVGLVVLSLIRGWLIPRSTHQEIVAKLERAILKLEATVAEREHQVSALMTRSRESAP
jgi:hypothetical protein